MHSPKSFTSAENYHVSMIPDHG